MTFTQNSFRIDAQLVPLPVHKREASLGNGIDALFFDNWVWLMFVGVGLLLILLELFFGVYTGLDLVFVGTAFILGGIITVAFHSWVLTVIISGIICFSYIFLGRKYIHRQLTPQAVKTNIDTIIGKSGTVTEPLTSGDRFIVRVGNETWQAISDQELHQGDTVKVRNVKGVTLIIEKDERSDPV